MSYIKYNPKLKERARELRQKSTPSEITLWKRLQGGQMRGYTFNRQKPLDNYIVDFYNKKLKRALQNFPVRSLGLRSGGFKSSQQIRRTAKPAARRVMQSPLETGY